MKRHTEELKEVIGEWLRRDPGRGKLKILAESLRVSPKTLNNWKRKRPARAGRPKYTFTQRKAALIAVGRALRRLGYPGEKAIERELPHVPLRLVREYVKLFKAKRRARLSLRRRSARQSVKVKATNVIMSQDGAHLGRSGRDPVDVQLAKDRASLKITLCSVGPPTADHALENLEEIRRTRGLPLVWSTDNGSAYVAESVCSYLERHQVVHLLNLPRTPEHNAAIERTVREVKDASALGKWARVSAERASSQLSLAISRLNAYRYRNSAGNCADVLDVALPASYNLVNRSEFYAECRAAMCRAKSGHVNARKARLVERNAVYETLAKYGLVEITIGGK